MRYQPNSPQAADQALPWYRQFWPWFIIALPTAAVIGSFISLWLAVSHPDFLVVTDDEYQQIKDELKALPAEQQEQGTQSEDPTDAKSK